ncbi:hypothetical protein SFC88_09690 [Nocardioides sp. HM23]|uniref:hypothetical protein n=1 Tax=Nocardioides bizhenqiangii TaxID=3095076 RepID=UPI002ACA4913|nr:hypothetical protein [Nocardioides sp. HM23]MDZ5621099.1 hypothetical protein [Nocardioides sp. HM23]
MTEVLHAGAVVPAAVGLCCVARDRARVAEMCAGALMLLAMLDLALGSPVLSAAAWSTVLIGTAGWLTLSSRLSLAPPCAHSVLGTALMAVCAAVMAVRGHVHALAVETHRVGHVHDLGHEVVLGALLVAAIAGTAVYLSITWRGMRDATASASARVAAGSMAASLVIMLAAATV